MIKIFPELYWLKSPDYDFSKLRSWHHNVKKGRHVKIYPISIISDTEIGDYTYISDNSLIANTSIGKFCSIGPNLMCGWGAHPVNGLSTAPMFYAKSNKPNEVTLSKTDKIEEHRRITIGNDVFIGANVTILEGITIGNGAVIGAGAVVSKDIPPYAIAVGSPIMIKKYRFSESQIEDLQKIEWWNFPTEKLTEVERYFFDIDIFISKYRQA
jgi:acetyltransferase-like isoleucine patch superfamily enzyme